MAIRGIANGTSPWLKHVLYIDRGIIVLNKPPGLVCQSSSTEENSDVFSRLLDDLTEAFGLKTKPYPVHRLDKATTGAFVLARTKQVARELSQQFQSRSVEKTYLALVRGGEKSFWKKSGEICVPLHFEDGRAAIASHNVGKAAATGWELLASSTKAPLSLVKLRLHTGLKHQLRVHLAQSLYAPILGDVLHSRSETVQSVVAATKVPEDRLFLHASHISLLRYKKSGPNKRFRLGLTAPLPKDFLKICADLGLYVEMSHVNGGLFMNGTPTKEVSDTEGQWLI